MEIKTNDYNIWYDAETKTVYCQGSLRLIGMAEYAPLVELLDAAIATTATKITLNLQNLDFLNSSGINVLSKFVLKVRQQEDMQMVVEGSNSIHWQAKSLKNLQRLMPSLQLNWE